jgi:hypothetical protein
VPGRLERRSCLSQHAARRAVAVREQPEQQVLGADMVVAETARLDVRGGDDGPGPV